MRRIMIFPSALVAASSALVILAVVVGPFLSPAWVAFEQGRANAAGWTGYTAPELRFATDAILHDLVIGPPAFDVSLAGTPVLNAAERSHMRDVRGVFAAFYLLAAAGLLVLVLGRLAARGSGPWNARRYIGSVRAGAAGLVVVVVAIGIVAAIAFDAAFEMFHRLFFPAGTYNFDPRVDRLVQLFPDAFWSETTLAVGAVTITCAILVILVTGRRLRKVDYSPVVEMIQAPR